MSTALDNRSLDGRSPTLELLRLAAPMVGVTVSRMMMGFIDFVMVSQLDTAAQAAISPATLMVFALGCLGMGVSQAVQTFVSQSDGRGEPRVCGSYGWQSFYIALVWGLVTAPAILTLNQWFGWLGEKAGHPADALAQEIAYLDYALWSIAPAIACMGLENFFNGIRRPRVALYAVTASLVSNGIGNYLLIFGKFGFPEMGIAGAALATLIAWCVRLAVLVAAFLSASTDGKYNTRASFAPNGRRLGELLRIGGPTAVQWLIDIGAWVIFLQVIMPPFGKEALAATNIVIQYMHLAFMPALGVGMALTSQVGFAIGQGDPERAELRVRTAQRVILGYMAAIALLMVLMPRALAGLLAANGDAAVIAAGAQILIWAALFQVSDGMCITYSFGLRGAGDTRRPAVLFAVCCWVIFIGGGIATTYLFPQWGFHGPWAMCTAYIVVLGVLLAQRFYSGAWRKIRIFAPDAARAAATAAVEAEPAPEMADAVPAGGIDVTPKGDLDEPPTADRLAAVEK